MNQMIEAIYARQCVILVGGSGTRLGGIVQDTPKPLLNVAGKPLLTHLIREVARFGFTKFLLLAGYRANVVRDYFAFSHADVPEGVSITVTVEANPLGTGGALLHAANLLDPTFLLCNGDSLCLFNLLRMTAPLRSSRSLARMALMPVECNTRYGQVLLKEDLITGFIERSTDGGPGMMNTGVYFMRREVVDTIPPGKISLEADVFPRLAASGLLEAERVSPHFFIDIGIPEDFTRAQSAVSEALYRPAVFFDRDGVLNHDLGHVHTVNDFHWIDGAKKSILACNDAGYYVFVVTNQAGIAKGYYSEAAMHALHAYMQEELYALSAHVDKFAFCPHHPDGIVKNLRRSCLCRKPQPGMILRLCADWPIDSKKSFFIGDKQSDIQAAKAAGISGHLFFGGNLSETLLPHLHLIRPEIFP